MIGLVGPTTGTAHPDHRADDARPKNTSCFAIAWEKVSAQGYSSVHLRIASRAAQIRENLHALNGVLGQGGGLSAQPLCGRLEDLHPTLPRNGAYDRFGTYDRFSACHASRTGC